MKIKIKRVYETAEASDGYRILVDRLWPRGFKKTDAQFDKWLKEIAPSTALRKWFNHDPEKWSSFITRYKSELTDSAALEELRADVRKHKNVTLLFGARDQEHNHAQVLAKLIKGRE